MRNKELTEMRDRYCMDFIVKSVKEGIRENETCKELYTFYEPLFKDYEAVRNYYRSVLGKKGFQPRTLDIIPDYLTTIVNKHNIMVKELNKSSFNNIHKESKSNISTLIIGDTHEPFSLVGYREFCYEIYNKYNCNNVVFIGDLIDNHFSSFHDTDPDGHGAAEELRLAKAQIKEWYKTFPVAKVCIGNHDLIPVRKSFNAGLSKIWIKSISEVLDTPNWEYAEEFIINDVLYTHGTGRKARERMKQDMVSVVQGHYHSESYIEYSVGIYHKLFAMQVGCGIDKDSYAMAYGKNFAKPHINCGVIVDNVPMLIYMDLNKA